MRFEAQTPRLQGLHTNHSAKGISAWPSGFQLGQVAKAHDQSECCDRTVNCHMSIFLLLLILHCGPCHMLEPIQADEEQRWCSSLVFTCFLVCGWKQRDWTREKTVEMEPTTSHRYRTCRYEHFANSVSVFVGLLWDCFHFQKTALLSRQSIICMANVLILFWTHRHFSVNRWTAPSCFPHVA